MLKENCKIITLEAEAKLHLGELIATMRFGTVTGHGGNQWLLPLLNDYNELQAARGEELR